MLKAGEQKWGVGVVLAVAGTFLFALKSIFIKLAYAEGATVDEVILLRMIMASPFYLGVLYYLKRREKIPSSLDRKTVVKILAFGFLGYFLASYLDLAGLVYISAQLERLTLFTYPTMIAILAAIFLKEKITRKIILSLVLCYAGLSVMYGQEKLVMKNDRVALGVGLVLGSALSYSVYVILAKPVIEKLGSRLFTCIAMLGSSLFVMLYLFGIKQLSITQVKPEVWMYCFLLAFVCTVFPSFMITEAIARIGATRTTIVGSVGPIFTIILAVFTIHEPFTWWHALGVAFVLTGVFFVTQKNAKKKD